MLDEEENVFIGKKIHCRREGDIIEIHLKDGAYNTYFKGKANVNDKKQMSLLIGGLREKGIVFNESWL